MSQPDKNIDSIENNDRHQDRFLPRLLTKSRFGGTFDLEFRLFTLSHQCISSISHYFSQTAFVSPHLFLHDGAFTLPHLNPLTSLSQNNLFNPSIHPIPLQIFNAHVFLQIHHHPTLNLVSFGLAFHFRTCNALFY